MTYYKVTYKGFIGPVDRYFYTHYHAEQWTRAVGKHQEATITEHWADYPPLTTQGELT